MLDELHKIWGIMFDFQRRKHPVDPHAGEPKLFREAGDPLIELGYLQAKAENSKANRRRKS
jgi:hypothetical protein